jgi:hypothetical protein
MFHILIHERHVNQKLYDSISSQSDWQLSRKQTTANTDKSAAEKGTLIHC